MKRLTQLILVMILCFTIEAKAQITKIETYTEHVKDFSSTQKDEINMLFFGTVPKIFISETGKEILLWADKGSFKTVELNYQQIEQLKNAELLKSYKTVEVISLNIEKGKAFKFDDSYLAGFPNLKYLLINSSDGISVEEVKQLLADLLSSSALSNQIQVIINKTNTSS